MENFQRIIILIRLEISPCCDEISFEKLRLPSIPVEWRFPNNIQGFIQGYHQSSIH